MDGQHEDGSAKILSPPHTANTRYQAGVRLALITLSRGP
jgi:hypothetical protein